MRNAKYSKKDTEVWGLKMEEMSEEEFIKLYKLCLKLHPEKRFIPNIRLIEKDGELVSPNPKQTKSMRNKFAHYIIRTGPEMYEILKLLKYGGVK